MHLYSIETGNFKLDGGAMFGVLPKSMWNKRYPADDNNLCNWSMRCMLAVDGNRKILVDTGIGNKQDAKFFSYYYLNGEATLLTSLEKIGVAAADITDVILTHLHFDHCGAAVTYNNEGKLVPTFPNAKYWVSLKHWDWAVNPNAREKASFLRENFIPLLEHDRLSFVEKEGEIMTGVQVKLFDGHTEAQMIPIFHTGSKTVAYVADLIPASIHIPPHYIISYDIRPLVSMDEKQSFLTEAVAENYALFFEHDLYNECCTVENTIKGFREAQTFTLNKYMQS